MNERRSCRPYRNACLEYPDEQAAAASLLRALAKRCANS